MPLKIYTIVNLYPSKSEVLVAQELALLQEAGFDLHIISTMRPGNVKKNRQTVHRRVSAPIFYLTRNLFRYLRAWFLARRLPNYKNTFSLFLTDLRRIKGKKERRRYIRTFIFSLVVATELDFENPCFLYAEFMNLPATLARYVSHLRGVKFGISAHAIDIWKTPKWDLQQKLIETQFVVSCTSGGVEYLKSLAQNKNKIHLLYHGLTLEKFATFNRVASRDGKNKNAPIRLLSAGRIVEKKGLDCLIEALHILQNNFPNFYFHWNHIGSGKCQASLLAMIKKYNLTNKIIFSPIVKQEQLIESYRKADIFVLPCRIADDGDRDGLPNVIVEALSQSLVVISSNISGIPELVENNVCGILLQPDSPKTLAQAIYELGSNPNKRLAMGLEGAKRVHENFDSKKTIAPLLRLLRNE